MGESMTAADLDRARQLQDSRVHLVFTDGQQVRARLLSVTTDADGGQHLLYDEVEWSAQPHNEIGSGAFYVGGDEIVSLLPAIQAAPFANPCVRLSNLHPDMKLQKAALRGNNGVAASCMARGCNGCVFPIRGHRGAYGRPARYRRSGSRRADTGTGVGRRKLAAK